MRKADTNETPMVQKICSHFWFLTPVKPFEILWNYVCNWVKIFKMKICLGVFYMDNRCLDQCST